MVGKTVVGKRCDARWLRWFAALLVFVAMSSMGNVAHAQEQVSQEVYGPEEPVPIITAQGEQVGSLMMGRNLSTSLTTKLPLLSGGKIDIFETVFPISYEKLKDGTEVYVLGITQSTTKLYNELISGKGDVWNTCKQNFMNTGTKANKMRFSPIYSVCGVCRIKDGISKGDGAVMIGIKGSVEGQFYFFTGGVEITGTIGAKFPFTYPTDKLEAALGVTGGLGVKLFGGVGAAYIGRVGLYGKASLEAMHTLLPRSESCWNYLRLKGSAGVELVVAGFTIASKDLWKGGPWDLITPHTTSVTAQSETALAGPPALLPQDAGIDPRPINYDPRDAGAWQGNAYVPVPERAGAGGDGDASDGRTSDLSIAQEEARLLESDNYPDAQVEIAETKNATVMCWLDAERDAAERVVTKLMWSRSSAPAGEGTWSQPRQVSLGTRADTADFEPDLVADEAGNVHVVWLDLAEGVGNADFTTLTDNLCVSYACLTAGAGDFGPTETVVTQNAGSIRTAPKVAATGTGAICGFSTIEKDHLLDLAGTHEVFAATRSGEGWSVSRRYLGTNTITSLDAGVLGDVPALAWVHQDLDCDAQGNVDGVGPSTIEVLTAQGQTHTLLGTNALFDDHHSLTWRTTERDDGTCDLMEMGGAGTYTRTLASGVSLPDAYQLAGDVDGMGALITYQAWESPSDGSEPSADVFGRSVSQGKVSEEELLVAHEDDLTSHDVAFCGDEPVVVAAAETGIGYTNEKRASDLIVAAGESLNRISFVGINYDAESVHPGSDVAIDVQVRNAGLTTIEEGVEVLIRDQSDSVIGSAIYKRPIAPNELVTIRTMIKAPNDLDPENGTNLVAETSFAVTPGTEPERSFIDGFVLLAATNSVAPGPSTPVPTPSYPGYPDVVYSGGTYSGDTYDTHTDTWSTAGPEKTSPSVPVTRYAGGTRYATMEQAVSSAFDHSDWVVLASGVDFPDALCAASVAGVRNAPVILTAPDALSGEAAREIGRLGATHVVLMGGDAALSEALEVEVRSLVGDVSRVAGADRVSTSIAALDETLAAGSATDTVIVTTGDTFADALSIGPWAFRTQSPVILARAGHITEEAVSAIRGASGIRRVIILGGASAVTDEVRAQLGDGYEYVRLGGADRYETSAVVAAWTCDHGLGWAHPFVATGQGFADALSGSAVAGRLASPMLLTDGTGTRAASALRQHAASVEALHVLGGESAVSTDVERVLATAAS